MKTTNNMFPTRQSLQYAGLAGATFLILTAVYAGAFVLLQSRSQAAQKANQQAREIAESAAQRAELESLLETTATDRELVSSFFVPSDGVADFISTVESTADDTRVQAEISNISITNQGSEDDDEDSEDDSEEQTDANGPLLETLVLDIRATGSWARVMHFVRTLELLPMQAQITDLSLERVVNETDSGTVSGGWRAVFTFSVTKESA